MSIYLAILMGLLVIGLFSLLWERRWKAYRAAAKAAQEQAASATLSLRERVTQRLATVQANLPFRQPEAVAVSHFRAWAAQALATDPAVRNWLAALSDEAYTAFVEHVAEFAEEMGFALADLVTGQMTRLPDAAQRATAVITHFCRANYEAALAQDDFDGYRAYADYLHAPMSAAGQQFTQQLYAHLVDQKLTAAPTPDLLALTAQERLAQMQAAIQRAATTPAEFRNGLHAVVADQRRTVADFTVAKIVQRAMTKVVKPPAEVAPAPSPSTQTATPETPVANEEPTVVAV